MNFEYYLMLICGLLTLIVGFIFYGLYRAPSVSLSEQDSEIIRRMVNQHE